MLTAAQVAHFDLFGFVVLRSLLNPQEVDQLTAEVDGALRDAFADAYASNTRHDLVTEDDVAAEGNFLPLMANRSPLSQAMVVDDPRLSDVAGALLGDFTVASPALATCLVSDTPWHNDGGLGSRWLRCNAYLQPATQSSGALRVVPGSHDPETAAGIATHLKDLGHADADALPGVPLKTVPGDVIVFDPRLHHGSWGGGARLRWSVDYLAMPPTSDTTAMERTGSLVADLSDWPTTPNWPTWVEWQTLQSEPRKAAARKLRALGLDLST